MPDQRDSVFVSPVRAHSVLVCMNDDVFRLVRIDDAQNAGKDELFDDDTVAGFDEHLERLADAVLAPDRDQEIEVDLGLVNFNL